MAKVIRNLKIDLSDMAASGGNRSFSIEGDVGAIFSLEVKNEDGYYYNFDDASFAAAKSRLKQKAIIGNGKYSGNITFPSITDNDQYDIYLFADTHHDTVHREHKEVRFGDGSLDLNSSTGSNSNLLQKVIYQYTDTTITLTTGFEAGSSISWFDATETASAVVGRGKGSTKQPFTIGVAAPATKAIQILRQPTNDDWFFGINVRCDSPKIIEGEDIWAGTVRDTDTTNGSVSSGTTVTMDTAVASTMKVNDRVTGVGISSASVVTVSSLSGTYTFVTSEAVTIGDGVTLRFTPAYYRRFGTKISHADGNVIGLASGLKESLHAAAPGTIGPYEDSTTYTTEILNADGSITEQANTTINVSAAAIDTTGFTPTVVNGKVTKQDGLICFETALIADRATDETFSFYLRGTDTIKSYFNTEVKFTDLTVSLTAPTTTTTSAVSNSTSIPVADREGVIHSISTISGIGIDSSVANPTIASGGQADGAGTWVASAAQTLESGITLTVGETSRNVTITGNIEVLNCGNSNFTIYLDIYKFLTGT